MEEMRSFRRPDVVNPSMIAGWPGMGNVALGAVDYLRRKLGAVKFAEVQLDRYSALESVVVDNGLATFPKPPKNSFYYTKNPDMIIFEGETQASGPGGASILGRVLDVAMDYRVKRIYTGAAFPAPISHNEPVEVYGAYNTPILKPMSAQYGIRSMENGHIAGLNGLLLGFAAKRGIEAVCLLATMPQYALTLPNPKGSLAIIDILGRMLGFKVDAGEMQDFIEEINEKMALIEDKVKDVFVVEKHETPEYASSEKKMPPYIAQKIERLFDEVRLDRSKADTLKRELDRWDLYSKYEDRFLDLFRPT